jgi:hypothetical protein
MRIAPTMLALAVMTCSPAAAAAQVDPFARRAWVLDLSATGLSEAWNYNESREELYGVDLGMAYAARDGLVLHVGSMLAYTSQRGADAVIVGVVGGPRWAVFRRAGRSLTIELDVGVSRAELPVPPRGTRFNYVFRPTIGAVWPIGAGLIGTAGLTWLHLSNNGLAGRHRNPDVQAIGLRLGVLLPF